MTEHTFEPTPEKPFGPENLNSFPMYVQFALDGVEAPEASEDDLYGLTERSAGLEALKASLDNTTREKLDAFYEDAENPETKQYLVDLLKKVADTLRAQDMPDDEIARQVYLLCK